jgi:metal-sulfur cluster biosynthetic enzyme
MIDKAQVLEALGSVRDPELDEPITELRFVEGLDVREHTVRVRLRLPTYFCAPNFSYIMAADAKAAISSLPDVRDVEITLVDHFASEEINTGVNEDSSFEDTFQGQAEGGVESLKDLFLRKAFIARQEKLCEALLHQGLRPEDLSSLQLKDLPSSTDLETYRARRRELGLDVSPEALLLVTPKGTPIPEEEITDHLRLARAIRVSIELNAGLCRSLLATRYGIADPEEVLL